MNLSFLASLGDQASGLGQVVFVLSGFLFVIFVLMVLAVITSGISVLFRAKGYSDAVAQPPGALPSSKGDELEPHFAAVVAAAVHLAMGEQPHRVVAIRETDKRQ